MKEGYSRKTTKLVPLLPSKHLRQDDQARRQQQLLKQVRLIDQILKSDHLNLLHGFIFTDQPKNRLTDDILSALTKRHRLISYGFNFGPLQNIQPTPSFKTKLLHASIHNIQRYQIEKHKQISKLSAVKALQQLRNISLHGQQNNKSTYSQIHSSESTAGNTPKRQRFKVEFSSAKKVMTEISNAQQDDQAALLCRIQKIIRKNKYNLVSIWIPPKSYPQFYGIFIPLLVSTSNTLKCRIRKYCFFKQGLNKQLSQAILNFLSQKFSSQIASLELIAQKQHYYSGLKDAGWKIVSWQGPEKLLLSFSKPQK